MRWNGGEFAKRTETPYEVKTMYGSNFLLKNYLNK